MHVYVCKNITNFMKKQRPDIQDQENKKKTTTHAKGVYYQYKHESYNVLQVKIKFRIKYFNQGHSMGRGQVPPPPPSFFPKKFETCTHKSWT